MGTFKQKPSCFSVFALHDGTIWLALQTRKPRKTRHFTPEIDVDGIHKWFPGDDDPDSMTDWAKSVRHSTIANCLNLKRTIRQQIEPKLNVLFEQIAALKEQLDRVEKKLDSKRKS